MRASSSASILVRLPTPPHHLHDIRLTSESNPDGSPLGAVIPDVFLRKVSPTQAGDSEEKVITLPVDTYVHEEMNYRRLEPTNQCVIM